MDEPELQPVPREIRKAHDLGVHVPLETVRAKLLAALEGMDFFEGFHKSDALLAEAEHLLIGEHPERITAEGTWEKQAKATMHDSASSLSESDKYYYLLCSSNKISVEQLIDVINYFGAERDNSDFLNMMLSKKHIVHNGRAYRILAFRCVAGKSFIQLEGFEHVKFFENNMNEGWIPVDKQNIERVLMEEVAQAVTALGEHLPLSPARMIELVKLLRDSKTPVSEISSKISENKPVVKVGEHGAVVDGYAEKGSIPVIHFQGFPSRAFTLLDNTSIESSVRVAHLLKQLDEKLAKHKPFNIGSLSTAMSASQSDLSKVTEFSPEFTAEDVEALLFFNRKKGIVII